MKLYNVPRNTWVMPLEEVDAPPGARAVSVGEVVKLHHIDGMYSYCTDAWGEVVHLPAWQRVVIASEPK